jgi:hypothetical protein
VLAVSTLVAAVDRFIQLPQEQVAPADLVAAVLVVTGMDRLMVAAFLELLILVLAVAAVRLAQVMAELLLALVVQVF